MGQNQNASGGAESVAGERDVWKSGLRLELLLLTPDTVS